MKLKISGDLWIIGALFIFTLVVAYLTSAQRDLCLDLSEGLSVWDLTAWPIKAACLQLLAVFGLLAFTLSRRFISPVPYVEEQQRTQGEYVSSMARLLQSAQEQSRIVETLSKQFQQEICRKLALPSSTPKSEMIQILKQHPNVASQIESVLTEADAFQVSERQRDVLGMIRWARKISGIRQQWRRGI